MDPQISQISKPDSRCVCCAYSRFLTRHDLAAQLRCSVAAVRVWQRQGLPTYRFGRLVRYRLDEVISWFEAREPRQGVRLK